MISQFRWINSFFQFCTNCSMRAYIKALSAMFVIYFILGGFDENFNYGKILVTDKKDYLILKNVQEIYQFVIRKTKIEDKSIKSLLNLTLERYLPDKTPLQFLKVIEARAIPKELQIKYNKTITINEENYFFPLLIMFPWGRLGNLMGEYASLFSLGKLYNASVFIHNKTKKKLDGIFPNISLKVLPSDFDTEKCMRISYDRSTPQAKCNYSPIQLAAAGLLGPQCFLLNAYPFEMKLFHSIRNDIVKEFKFSEKILKKVGNFFASIEETKGQNFNREDYNFVGIHVRLTDYDHHMHMVFGGTIPSDNYVSNAIKYIKAKHKNPIFIAASDNVTHLMEILVNETNVFYPNSTPDVDMAILSSCNHSIFTLGSYGFWASYLAGGEVLYADVNTIIPFTHSTSFYVDANLTNFVHIEDSQ